MAGNFFNEDSADDSDTSYVLGGKNDDDVKSENEAEPPRRRTKTEPTVDDSSLDSSVSSEGFISANECSSDDNSSIDTNKSDEKCDENEEETAENGIITDHEVFHPTYINVEWVKGIKGSHDPIIYDGPITQNATFKTRRFGMANKGFFQEIPLQLIASLL